MSRLISIVNQKGGVGKTTTAVNVAGCLAAMDQRVLLVDLDPQGNASSGLGFDPQKEHAGLYETLVLNEPLDRAIATYEPIQYLHVVPATLNLAGANVDLVSIPEREFRLHNALSGFRDRYDFIIVDNPPSLGLLTINGLAAADEILIPVQCEYYALEGLSQLLHTIELVQQGLRPDIKILGAVMTMYDRRNQLSDAVFEEMYRYFPHRIFRSIIPRNVRLAEAPSYGKPILLYDPLSKGAKAYARLAKEILDTASYGS
ncbi:MAG: ParA family protein [Patescibacteria group bacterium]